MKKSILYFSILFLVSNQVFAQYGTKGIIELKQGKKIKPQKIETKEYVLVGMDSFLTHPENLLKKVIRIFDEHSRETQYAKYENQDKHFQITEREYNSSGDLIKRIEKSNDKLDRITVYQYEYDSLGNWTTMKEFILDDTLKYKYCSTRKIEYRVEDMEEYRLVPQKVMSYSYYGPISKIYLSSRRYKQENCGELDIAGRVEEYVVNPNSSEIDYKHYHKSKLIEHRIYYSENGKTEIRYPLKNETKSTSIDTVYTKSGFEIKRQVLKNEKLLSETISKFDTNRDKISEKTKSASPYSAYKIDAKYQYLSYNEFGEWTQRVYFKNGEPYFLIKREIEYQTHEE